MMDLGAQMTIQPQEGETGSEHEEVHPRNLPRSKSALSVFGPDLVYRADLERRNREEQQEMLEAEELERSRVAKQEKKKGLVRSATQRKLEGLPARAQNVEVRASPRRTHSTVPSLSLSFATELDGPRGRPLPTDAGESWFPPPSPSSSGSSSSRRQRHRLLTVKPNLDDGSSTSSQDYIPLALHLAKGSPPRLQLGLGGVSPKLFDDNSSNGSDDIPLALTAAGRRVDDDEVPLGLVRNSIFQGRPLADDDDEVPLAVRHGLSFMAPPPPPQHQLIHQQALFHQAHSQLQAQHMQQSMFLQQQMMERDRLGLASGIGQAGNYVEEVEPSLLASLEVGGGGSMVEKWRRSVL